MRMEQMKGGKDNQLFPARFPISRTTTGVWVGLKVFVTTIQGRMAGWQALYDIEKDSLRETKPRARDYIVFQARLSWPQRHTTSPWLYRKATRANAGNSKLLRATELCWTRQRADSCLTRIAALSTGSLPSPLCWNLSSHPAVIDSLCNRKAET